MNKLASGSCAAALWLVVYAAHASIITCTIDDVKFDDGGTATGFFKFDPMPVPPDMTLRLLDFDVTTTAGRVFPSFRYTPSTVIHSELNSSAASEGLALGYFVSRIDPTNPSHRIIHSHTIYLNFERGLFSSRGTFPISRDEGVPSYEVAANGDPYQPTVSFRYVVEGAATHVPEPSSLMLIAVGTGLLLMRLGKVGIAQTGVRRLNQSAA